MSARVLLLGAGPAGMSAAVWLRDLAIDFLWLEAQSVSGGALLRVGNPVDDLLGFPPMDGPALARQLRKDCESRGLTPTTESPVAQVLVGDSDFRCLDHTGKLVATCTHLLLCTGTQPRKLGLPQEISHAERGVEISVTLRREHYRGMDTVVVGGGDAALEGALLLSEVARSVTVVHRGDEFNAQLRFVEEARRRGNISLELQASVEAILESPQGIRGVRLSDGRDLSAQGVFVRIGVEPVLPAGLETLLGTDGYVETDARNRTRVPGVYAAGDLISADHQSVAFAIGSAARAVRTLADDLSAG